MSSQFLPLFMRNALVDNRALLPALRRRTASLDEALTFCRNLRVAGIGSLFLTGTPEVFHRRLQQSAWAFAWLLEGWGEAVKRTSRALPFFDAVAAGDFPAAARVAELSRRTCVPDEEYEEDFLFVEFLMQRFFLGATEDDCERLLGRYEQALQGAEDSRLPLCWSLLEREAVAFNEALSRFLSERSDGYEVRAEDEPPEILATEALLSVEGLALARLAERAGLSTEEDYLHVPSLAREGRAPMASAQVWEELEGNAVRADAVTKAEGQG
jgi:hypothetical protein